MFVLTLFDRDDNYMGSQTLYASWKEGDFLVPIKKLAKKISSGVWTIRVSVEKKTVAAISFFFLGDLSKNYSKAKYSNFITSDLICIFRMDLDIFYPVKEICSFNTPGRSLDSPPLCSDRSWSTFSIS